MKYLAHQRSWICIFPVTPISNLLPCKNCQATSWRKRKTKAEGPVFLCILTYQYGVCIRLLLRILNKQILEISSYYLKHRHQRLITVWTCCLLELIFGCLLFHPFQVTCRESKLKDYYSWTKLFLELHVKPLTGFNCLDISRLGSSFKIWCRSLTPVECAL